MLGTLMRVGEVSAARWDWIDQDARTLTIPAAIAKNGQAHDIQLSGFALRILDSMRVLAAGSPFIVPDKTSQAGVGEKVITKLITDRQRPAGGLQGRTSQSGSLVMPGGPWTSHDLRRTGATMMRSAGVSREIIERCLNHVDGETRLERTYQVTGLIPERRDAFDRLGALLDALVPPAMTAHLTPRRSA
jgi:integrase